MNSVAWLGINPASVGFGTLLMMSAIPWLAYTLGQRRDKVFNELKALL